jgi:hypothetical protein
MPIIYHIQTPQMFKTETFSICKTFEGFEYRVAKTFLKGQKISGYCTFCTDIITD